MCYAFFIMKNFKIGCNYWASNAGMMMWRDFDEKTVEKDFAFLAAHGVDTVRIFPLWPDFQPIEDVMCSASHRVRFNGKIRPDTELGRAGIDEEMMRRFSFVLDTAEKYRFEVIVSLLTGWMSGRLFLPRAIEHLNAMEDPASIKWQLRFVKAFIKYFKNRKVICAWEPGNECNCMGEARSRDSAALWLAAVCDAIKCADPSRPVYAGMHSLTCSGTWAICDVAEQTDMLTTHPYPLFTPFCSAEKITDMRAALHAAAESCYYAGVGGVPCMAEEIGTLGPMIADDETAALYAERSMLSCFAYGVTGYLWWCAFDQDKFDFSPYDSLAVEQNLGLARDNGHAKPVLERFASLARDLKDLALPAPQKDGVVLLSNAQDDWAAAYGAFSMAAQAGLTLDFMYEDQPLKESEIYLLPCICGTAGIPRRLNRELAARVHDGATLFISYENGYLGFFEELTGLLVKGRENAPAEKVFRGGKIGCTSDLLLESAGAKVLLRDESGNILLSENDYGKGKVYFFNAPLETYYTKISRPHETELYKIYQTLFTLERNISFEKPKDAGVSYHETAEGEIAFIVFYGEKAELAYRLKSGYEIEKALFCEQKDEKIIPQKNFCAVKIRKT